MTQYTLQEKYECMDEYGWSLDITVSNRKVTIHYPKGFDGERLCETVKEIIYEWEEKKRR